MTALENSLQALNEVNPVADGTDALNAAIDDVASSLDAARDSASEELQPQLEDVATAFDSLQEAGTGLTTDNLTQKAPEIASALNELSTAAAALSTSVTENCVTS